MNTMQLTSSLVQDGADGPITLFIGSEGGRLGLVRAGTWETVLPFVFDEIRPLDGNLLSARRGRCRTIYRTEPADGLLRAIPLPGSTPAPRAIALPA